jgi:hypothetical protein
MTAVACLAVLDVFLFSVAAIAATCVAPSIGSLMPGADNVQGFQPTVPGVYTLQAALGDGCQTFQDTVDVTVVCPPPLDINATTNASTATFMWGSSGGYFSAIHLDAAVSSDATTSTVLRRFSWTVLDVRSAECSFPRSLLYTDSP